MLHRLLLLFFVMATSVASAQVINLSPYSQFGLGDLYQTGSVSVYGLGGSAVTYNDRFQVNSDNPATLGYLNNTIFQTALRFQNLRLTNGENQSDLSGGNLDQFQLGMKRGGAKTGFVFGLTPFSTTGYDVNTSVEDSLVGTIDYNYTGDGGINRLFAGAGRHFDVTDVVYFRDKDGNAYDSLKVTRHSISAGAKFNYYFGSQSQTRALDIQDVTFLDTRRRTVTRLFDFGIDVGVHYQTVFGEKYGKDKRLQSQWVLQVGATHAFQSELNTRFEETAESTTTSSDVVFPVDTTYSISGRGSSVLPSRTSVGVGINYFSKEGRHFMFTGNYSLQDWSSFQIELEEDIIQPNLVASDVLSVGFEYTPKSIEEGDNLLSRTQYRLGMRIANTYIELDGTQIVDQAITAGFSMPLLSSRSASKFHFGMEFGSRGMNEGELIKEDYLNIFVGVTLSPFYKNVWFKERKYD